MNEMLMELESDDVGAYVDDIYVFSETYEKHMEMLERLFKVLLKYNMIVSLKKC